MVSFLVRVATLAVVVLAMAGPAASDNSPLNHLDGADLIDLLDAELDEEFLTNGFRNLQQQFEMTGSPTPSPTAGTREFETLTPTSASTFAPTSAPTASPTALLDATASPTMMAIETPAPTASDSVAASVTSGAVSWRPASAVALALAGVVTAATAVLA